MKIIFAGTPEFAKIALNYLQAAHFDVVLVLTQPDRPAGRGLKLQASPVKQWAIEHHKTVIQPRSLRLDGKFPDDALHAQKAILQAQADVMIVAAYGLILPNWVLNAPRLGCLNIHGSLLPRWRGAAPIHRAIEAGDTQTGITIMQMDAGLDTGDMLLMESVPIDQTIHTAQLHDQLAHLGGRLIVQALELAACGGFSPQKQPEIGVTYAHKIEKHEAQINWAQSAEQIARRVRAFDPFPVAQTQLKGEMLKIWDAQTIAFNSNLNFNLNSTSIENGKIVHIENDALYIQCGNHEEQQTTLLQITQLQRAGGKRLSVAEFLRGFSLKIGDVLG